MPAPWNRHHSTIGTRPAAFVVAVRDHAKSLRSEPDAVLRIASDELRADIRFRRGRDEALPRAMALTCEAARRVLGIELYDVQLQAAAVLAQRGVAEMRTGEGKTYVSLLAAVWYVLAMGRTHVVTANKYLAERDCETLAPVFHLLGMTTRFLPEGKASVADKMKAYDADVMFCTGYELGFDHLKDQLRLGQESAWPLGASVLRKLRDDVAPRSTVHRPLRCAIVDEIDQVLIDDACSPLIISEVPPGEATDAGVHRAARRLILGWNEPAEYSIDRRLGQITITDDGESLAHACTDLSSQKLLRPWIEYVEQALRAEHLLHRDGDYVLHENEVQIVDQATGRIFEDRKWSGGLHQAVLAKENVPVVEEAVALARITRQRFFRMYPVLCGMTGTAAECRHEFASVYALPVTPIPPRVPSQRRLLPNRFFARCDQKWDAIGQAVQESHAAGRAVLVGTQSIADSESLARRIEALGLPFTVLNGRQDAEEAAIIARAGRSQAITIATNLAGRGTDIHLHDDVQAAGGLHVIVAERALSKRIDRQLIGRGARQGDPGSAQVFLSAEDPLLAAEAPWLAERLQRNCPPTGTTDSIPDATLEELQRRCERRSFQGRHQMLKLDLRRDSVLTGNAAEQLASA